MSVVQRPCVWIFSNDCSEVPSVYYLKYDTGHLQFSVLSLLEFLPQAKVLTWNDILNFIHIAVIWETNPYSNVNEFLILLTI